MGDLIESTKEPSFTNTMLEADLVADLNYHKALLAKRDNDIWDLEESIQILHGELRAVRDELEKSKSCAGEMQQRVSRSYRGSISQMESRVLQVAGEHESHIQEIMARHQEELVAMQNALKRQEVDHTSVLNERMIEIEELKGRLEESRSAREDTLVEMKLLQKNSEATIKSLEKSIAELIEKYERLEEYHGTKEHEMKEIMSMEKKYNEIIQGLESVTKELVEKNEGLEAQVKELEAKKLEYEYMKDTNAKNVAVMKEYKEELKEVKLAKKKIEENAIQEAKNKELVIEEKARKIFSLSANNDILKQALAVLETQLNELERVIADQGAEMDEGAKVKLSLESQIQSLKDELKRSRAECNDAESRLIFSESKLKDLQSKSEALLKAKAEELDGLRSQIQNLTENNHQLSGQVESLLMQIEEFDLKEDHYKKMIEELRDECGSMREDCNKTLHQMVKIKETNMELQTELDLARRRCDEYNDRIDSINEELNQLEIEKLDDSKKFQEMISQNVKLIEYLQKQVETLQMSKKKKFGGWFSGREREEKENSSDNGHVQPHLPPPSTPKKETK